MNTPIRLHKLLADAGVASRRAAERLIAEGRVSVNGVVRREPGSAAVPGRDAICVDGVPLRPSTARTYLLLHKPRGYVTSVRDPHAEHTVMELIPRGTGRVYPVGRLDRDSEGLLLLTDDGDLTERLLHPRRGVEREYAVLVRGAVTPGALARLREGIDVEGARVVPVEVAVKLPPPPFAGHDPPGTRWLRITLREGRKREVRVMCAAVHLHVLRLVRVRFGPLHLGDLRPGASRPLTETELAALNAAAGRAAKPRPAGAPARKHAGQRAAVGKGPSKPRPPAASRAAGSRPGKHKPWP